MKKLIITTAAVIAFSTSAMADGPKLLTNAELDKVVAGWQIENKSEKIVSDGGFNPGGNQMYSFPLNDSQVESQGLCSAVRAGALTDDGYGC